MFKILLVFIFLLVAQFLSAQQVTLKGKAYSVSSKEKDPLIGVVVMIKNTEKGVMTDESGSYRLSCAVGDTIKVSYIGFKNIEWIVNQDETTKNFYLEEEFVHISYIYECTLDRHAFSLLSAYAPETNNMGMSVGYKYSFNRFCTSHVNDSYLRPDEFPSSYSVSATYTRLDFNDDGLFYPQAIYNYNIPLLIGAKYPLTASAGAGYYWRLSDKFAFGSGNAVLSANVQYRYKHWFLKAFRLEFSGGYSLFINNKQYNHFSLGIAIYPFRSWI